MTLIERIEEYLDGTPDPKAAQLLQEIHDALVEDATYPPEEVKTTGKMKDEPWYPEYEKVLEIVERGDNNGVPFYFLDLGIFSARVLCRDIDVDEDRLKRWLESIFSLKKASVEKLKKQKDYESLVLMRPKNFFDLDSETQWSVDKYLGILDWQ